MFIAFTTNLHRGAECHQRNHNATRANARKCFDIGKKAFKARFDLRRIHEARYSPEEKSGRA